MSASLSTVVNALVSVLLKYHDSQAVQRKFVKNPQSTTDDYHTVAEELLALEHEELYARLTTCVKNATEAYTDRRPFLIYMLTQLQYFKPILDSDKPCVEADLCQPLIQLLTHATQLLQTEKSTVYHITVDDQDLQFNGLKWGRYYGGFCRSGTILKDELLARIGLSESSSQKAIEKTVRLIFKKLNYPRLEKENEALKTEVSSLKDCVRDLRASKSETNRLHDMPSFSPLLFRQPGDKGSNIAALDATHPLDL